MRQELSAFYNKMNSNLDLFERRVRDKDSKRKEEAQFIQEYDKELHSWNEDLQVKNKAVLDELQHEKSLRADAEDRLTRLQAEQGPTHADTADSDQEKLALLEELEAVTQEKDNALARLEAEQARFNDDAAHLSSLEDEDLERMEEDHHRALETIAKARELKAG